ncbi:SRPBCC domain-containing protein [Streptomyces pactum]|uniref:SRPBCC domain-containing protein n=1 Tax=Streptomyces pactum TaxID=68249 RepID=A0ABS0NJU6_9ACTN|nr:SRPBCC domain-containing protein [Streptomyces pactum]MBH5335470.1 SRPBCC domain-containing protein [Streptomyces pactum]
MPTGLTKDAGWQIGVARTLDAPLPVVWDFISGPEGLALWLGPGAGLDPRKGARYETADGATGEVRGYRARDRVRVTHRLPGQERETTVQVTVSPAGGDAAAGRTVLRFHQERLADAGERAGRREHWRSVLDAVAAALSPDPAAR